MANIDKILENVFFDIKSDILKEDSNKYGNGTIGAEIVRKQDVDSWRRKIMLAAINVERALRYYDSEGKTISSAQRPEALKKAMKEFESVAHKAKSTGKHVLNPTQFNIIDSYIEDYNTILELDDKEEVSKFVQDMIITMRRFGLGKYISDKDFPEPKNTPKGPAAQAWKANSKVAIEKYGLDNSGVVKDYTPEQIKANKETENESYGKMKKEARQSEIDREKTIAGQTVEKTGRKDLSAEERKQLVKGDAASQQKLTDLKIPTLKESPVDGCSNVKQLVAQWQSNGVKPEGQIELVIRGVSSKASAIISKPVVYINGKYYQVPHNDLYTSARNGIAVMPETKGYTKVAYNDPKHARLREKLQASVVTEMAENVKNNFNY